MKRYDYLKALEAAFIEFRTQVINHFPAVLPENPDDEDSVYAANDELILLINKHTEKVHGNSDPDGADSDRV